jgi:hypothetical protein
LIKLDGQSLEGLTEGEETDMEDEDISLGLNSNEELVSVQGQDGQQYVVLEVIQLEVNNIFPNLCILYDIL